MKEKLRPIIKSLVKKNFIWRYLAPFVKVSRNLQFHRTYIINKEKIDEELKAIYSVLGEPLVKNGTFKGLVYPRYSSFGGAILPKIIGSYEMEISPIFDKLCKKQFTEIIDIGCSEGYYAVGMAKHVLSAKIFAYDINKKARDFCYELAKLNKVEDRVFVDSECNEQTLRDFKFTGQSLIICDCEGCEKTIFTNENVNNLKNSELLIETHDFIDIEISTYLYNLFEPTHKITTIQSIDDIIKAKIYKFKETSTLNLSTKKRLFGEGRPTIMEWLYLEPKINL